jgi:thiol:disulfide interchange protein DsbD
MRINSLLIGLYLLSTSVFATEPLQYVDASVHYRSDDDVDISVVLPASAHNLVYADSLQFSVDNPDCQITGWKSSAEPIVHFDSSFKENKKAYDTPTVVHLKAKGSQEHLAHTNLHVSYYSKAHKKIMQEIIPLTSHAVEPEAELVTALDIPDNQIPAKNVIPLPKSDDCKKQSITDYISVLIQGSESRFVQLLLVFILGILMSLTPCIYPMIPITAGILQAQGTKSVLNSFLLTLSYTMGIATTFALLGLLASFAGQAFGSFMTNPFVVLTIVALLMYLAGSMLGLYEMHIPRFLQPKNQSVKGGSFVSAFIFGAVSGTVASPCLSPGLVLLLSIVSTLGSTMLGFVLLFVFGFGLSVPLLLVGTFSSSLSLLPRTGMWMVEVKRIFGFLLLAMCFYFMNNLLPWYLMLWGLALFVLASGVFYLYSAKNNSSYTRATKNIVGMLLVSSSVLLTFKGYQAAQATTVVEQKMSWQYDYKKALEAARQQGKKLFIDVGASFCSICKAIDREILSNDTVVAALEAHTIPLKIDGSDACEENFAVVKSRYKVIGFPSIFLVDPATETIIKRWGPELYSTAPADFINDIEHA